MDVEQLIAEVHERPAIWQTRHTMHHNRGFIETAWEQIALALNTTKDAARTKWKNLKDAYRKELRKAIKCSSGDAGGSLKVTNWPYFTMLDFLKNEVNTAQMTGNLKKTSDCSQQNENSEIVDEPEVNAELPDLDGSVYQPPSTENSDTQVDDQSQSSTKAQVCRKRKETVHETVAKKMLILEEKKVELLQNQNKQQHEDDSEDYHFLMSLLPHLKNVEPQRKLLVRNKITQVIIDETSARPTSVVSSRSNFSTYNYSDYGSPSYDPLFQTDAGLQHQ